jgi:hypothetical protein
MTLSRRVRLLSVSGVKSSADLSVDWIPSEDTTKLWWLRLRVPGSGKRRGKGGSWPAGRFHAPKFSRPPAYFIGRQA